MYFMKKIWLLMCIMLVSGAVFAQQRVSGTVKNRNGEPLIGANVYVKGTTITTITGINGEFNISAPSDAVLVIAYEGYYDLEVAVVDLPTVDLQLKPAMLSNIEAFYGNDNFYSLTTANTLIQIDDIETGLETDVYQFLLGKVPGLEVVPDASGVVHYRMRGGDSPTGNVVEPLFVVDGMYGDHAAVNALNPNNIESIRVLKDIPATVQYGERGRNGVIVIKTRQPSDKVLAVSYDGNASLNNWDDNEKWARPDSSDSSFKTSFNTKHNIAVRGLAGPMPYRASLGFNSIGSGFPDDESKRLSGSVWFGPRLLDKHLSIDFNGNYRKIKSTDTNYDYNYGAAPTLSTTDADRNCFSGILKADYSVHSLEDLHLNLAVGYDASHDVTSFSYYGSQDSQGGVDYRYSMLMLDGNVDIHHQFGKKYYLELKVGVMTHIYDAVYDEKESLHDDMGAFYGQFNVALNRYFMNINTRYNMYEHDNESYGKVTSAVSFGVKAGRLVTLHSGFGISGVSIGHRPDAVNSFDAFTYNFGVEAGTLKSVVYGSANFYVHHNEEMYYDYLNEQKYKAMTITNVGGDFRIGARLIDADNVKWRIGANMAVNAGVIVNSDDYEKLFTEQGDVYVSDDKPMTFNVFEPVYDQYGNLIEGMFIDHNDNGYFDNGDRISSERSPLPTVVGGFNTYLELWGGYLQINAHGSADRYNIYYKENSNNVDVYPDGALINNNIHNSSFLRIDNIVLGYRFSNLWNMAGRAYFALQNIPAITKYEGRDAEIYDGIDFYGIRQRPLIFSVGVKLNVNIKD